MCDLSGPSSLLPRHPRWKSYSPPPLPFLVAAHLGPLRDLDLSVHPRVTGALVRRAHVVPAYPWLRWSKSLVCYTSSDLDGVSGATEVMWLAGLISLGGGSMGVWHLKGGNFSVVPLPCIVSMAAFRRIHATEMDRVGGHHSGMIGVLRVAILKQKTLV